MSSDGGRFGSAAHCKITVLFMYVLVPIFNCFFSYSCSTSSSLHPRDHDSDHVKLLTLARLLLEKMALEFGSEAPSSSLLSAVRATRAGEYWQAVPPVHTSPRNFGNCNVLKVQV